MRWNEALRRGVTLAAVAAMTIGAVYEWGGPAARGVRELKKGEHKKAIESLREGSADLPRSAAVRYDQALAYEGAGFVDLARTAYREAARSPELEGDRARSSAAFNLGNQAMRAEKFPEAASFYRESLRVDPTRADAKKNLEEAIRRVRQARPQPQSGRGSQDPRTQGEENRSGGQSAASQPSKQDRDQQERPPSGREQPSPQLGTSLPSRGEAEHWLDALESERQAARRRERGGPEEERGERDW
jgi:tetratricopeptide (TPR) repeat protein